MFGTKRKASTLNRCARCNSYCLLGFDLCQDCDGRKQESIRDVSKVARGFSFASGREAKGGNGYYPGYDDVYDAPQDDLASEQDSVGNACFSEYEDALKDDGESDCSHDNGCHCCVDKEANPFVPWSFRISRVSGLSIADYFDESAEVEGDSDDSDDENENDDENNSDENDESASECDASINDFATLSESENEGSDESSVGEVFIGDYCMNCYRSDLPEEEASLIPVIEDEGLMENYVLDLHLCIVSDSSFRRKFCNTKASDHEEIPGREPRDRARQVRLCGKCRLYLASSSEQHKQNSKATTLRKLVWPAMVWRWLKSSKKEAVWLVLPELWRAWWRARTIQAYPALAGIVHEIRIHVADVTEVKFLIKRAYKRNRLVELKQIVNEHVLPTVKCPWGCDAFPDEVGGIALDVILARLHSSHAAELIGYSKMEDLRLARGIREDYLSAPWGQILCNPAWPVRPSIVFMSGIPFFATCPDHCRGDRMQYIHAPLPFAGPLSSPQSEQLAPVDLRCRTLKPFKSHAFSNTYSMHTMTGSAFGLDTAVIQRSSNVLGGVDFIKRRQNNASMNGRADCRSYIESVANGKTPSNMPFSVAETIVREANEASEEYDFATLNCGATYVTLHDAIKLQERLKRDSDPSSHVLIPVEGSIIETRKVMYVTPWPRTRVYAHPHDNYGAQFPPLPCLVKEAVRGIDARVLWFMLAIHVSQVSVWENTCKNVKLKMSWEGWLLLFVSQHCLTDKPRRPTGVFSWPKKSKATHTTHLMEHMKMKSVGNTAPPPFADGLFHPEHIAEMFSGHNNIIAIETRGSFDIGQVQARHSIALLYRKLETDVLDGRPLEDSVFDHASQGIWDLQFLGLSNSSINDDKPENWTGTVYVRHGGLAFPGWWTLVNSETHFRRNERIIPNEHRTTDWNCAIYKRRVVLNEAELRDRFILTIGGQTKAYCQEHDFPLLIEPRTRSRRCCMIATTEDGEDERCNKAAKFACVNKGCGSGLCIKHHRQLPQPNAYSERNLIAPIDEAVDLAAVDLFIDDDEEDDSDAGGDGPEITEAELDYLPPATVPHDPFAVDYLEDAEAMDMSDSDDEEMPPPIPTTHVGTELLQMMDPTGTLLEDSRESLPLHVILNCTGGIMARHKYKIGGTMNNRHVLEGIAAKSYGKAVPLIYPEGMLFPSIFWRDDDEKTGVLGAIPSGLLSSDSHLAMHGFASLDSHMRCRITNSSLGTHSNARYLSLAFDTLLNMRLRGCDSRVILHRGVETTDGGVTAKTNDTSLFDTDAIDSRPTVNKLAAAVAEEQCTYFLTLTANQKDHFGLGKLKEWMEGNEVIKEFIPSIDSAEGLESEEEIRAALRQGSAVLMMRQWAKTASIFMNYLAKSSEQPLGSIAKIWWRFEFQDAEGNLPHIHGVIWLKRILAGLDPKIALAEVLDRIRGSSFDLLRTEEVDALIQEGLLSDHVEAESVREHARRVLTHRCSNRCQKRYGLAEDETRCRVPHHGVLNPNPSRHTMRTVNIEHSEAAMQVLEILELYEFNNQSQRYELVSNLPDHENQILSEALRATKHSPPAVAAEGPFSPCNGRLFAATMSSQNLCFVTGYFASRYLAKYVAKVDEHNRVYFGAISKSANGISVDATFLNNTKVTGSAIVENERLNRRRDKSHPHGRAISQMESIMIMMGIPQVYTTIKFVHVPTCPLEERVGVSKAPFVTSTGQISDVSSNMIPALKVRNVDFPRRHRFSWPEWRRLSAMEAITVKDAHLSSVSVDAITVFSLRPPELRWVARPKFYYRWFYRDRTPLFRRKEGADEIMASMLDDILERSSWLDSLGHKLYVRRDALSEILNYLGASTQHHKSDFFAIDHVQRDAQAARRAYQITHRLFAKLKHLSDEERLPPEQRRNRRFRADWDVMYPLFMQKADSEDTRELPVIWYSSIKPTQPARFLFHILLSMGQFDCELNLYCAGSMKQAFIRARLIAAGNVDLPEGRQQLEQDIKILSRRYVLEQLVFLPGGTSSFDRHVVAAYNTLRRGLLEDSLPCNEIPACIFTRVRDQTSKEIREHIETRKATLLETTLEMLMKKGFAASDLPDLQDLLKATVAEPLAWVPQFPRGATQSEESHVEQQNALVAARKQLKQYLEANNRQTKNFMFVGGPGVGKTTLLQTIIVEASALGLSVAVTAVMSERSLQLGGEHLAKLMCIPVNERSTPCRIAELAMVQLHRNPRKLEFLKQLDVLCADEFGPISAETIAVIDMIMRRVRDSMSFMGGLLIFGSYDVLQLLPIHGLPPLLSPHMLTSFKFFQLDHSVRASDDLFLQRIQAITRMAPHELTNEILDEFRHLILEKCTHVPDWSHSLITPSTLRMFGKRSAVTKAEAMLLSNIRATMVVLSSHCYDMESTIEGIWTTAKDTTSLRLNRLVKEPPRLDFFQGAQYEITFNCPRGKFSQSQLAVLHRLPTDAELAKFEEVSVVVAPNGTKTIPEGYLNTDNLITEHGWKERNIGAAPERPESIRKTDIQAKRKQYGLRHRIASTIHAGQGQDLPKVATQVSLSEPEYMLWEKEQGIVLLSRTHRAADIIFVNQNKSDTVNALCNLLTKESQFSRYMVTLLRNLTSGAPPEITMFSSLDQSANERRQCLPFRPCDVVIPTNNSGYSYMLISLHDRDTVYIGATRNLYRRLREHNAGNGAETTRPGHLRPWGLLAYVTGFEEDSKICFVFERNWKSQLLINHACTPEEKAAAAKTLMANAPWRDLDLRYVKCGNLTAV